MPTDYNELYQARKAEFDDLYSKIESFVAEDFRFPDSPLAAIALSKRLDNLIIQALPAGKAIGADDKNAMYEVLSRNYQKIDFADREKAKLFRAAVVMLDTYESPTMTAVAAAANHEGKLTRSFLSEFTTAYREEDVAREAYNAAFDAATTREKRSELREANQASITRELEADRLALVQIAGDGVQQALIDSSQAEVIRLNTILQKLSDCPAHEGKKHLRKLLRDLESTGGVLAGNEALHAQIDQSPLTAGEAARASLARFDSESPTEASLPEGENREEKIRNLIIFMQKNPDICGALSLRGLNLTDVDLSGLNLSGIDLTGANLTGANLTGANLTRADLTDVILVGATLPKDLRTDFSFKYHGASITSEVLFSEVIIPARHQHYMASGKIAPNFGNIFDLLQFIQENPKNDFAKKLDHALMLCAIRHTALQPQKASGAEIPAGVGVDELTQWKEDFSRGEGMSEMSLTVVIENMRVQLPVPQRASDDSVSLEVNDTTQSKLLAGKREGSEYAVPFDFFERDDRRVINIAKTLDELPRDGNHASRVDRSDFAALISDIAKMDPPKTVNCIQMPLAAGRGREHFLHLQIYKKTSGEIGVRIIDSTTNHPLAVVPTDFVQAVLNENAAQLQKILGAQKAVVSPVAVVRTNEQMRPTDKKCPLYVAKGMQATTEKLLQVGAGFLQSDEKAKDAVRHQHHLVSKTNEMGTLLQLTYIEERASHEESDSARLRTESPAALDVSDERSRPLLSDVSQSEVGTRSQPPLDEWHDTERDVIGIAADRRDKQDKIAQSTFSKINDLLKGIDQDQLKEAVESALKTYIQSNTKGSMFLTLFRQASNAGKDYATEALLRVRNNPREALNVAREILYMGAKDDGKLEIKYNSRVQHLLTALESKSLIPTVNASNVGVRGAEVSMDSIRGEQSATRSFTM